MGFAKDRDLLLLEPTLFRDIGWSSQRIVRNATATVVSTTLTASSVDLAIAGVEAGHIALVGGRAMEIVERTSATQAVVSTLRASMEDAAVPPGDTAGDELIVSTFAPQIELIHRQLLSSVGVGAGLEHTESAVMNGQAIARVEALGALHVAFVAASAICGPTAVAWSKAEIYRERFAIARERAVVELDLDGDGVVGERRRFNTARLMRW